MPQGKYTAADVAPTAPAKPQGKYTMADVAPSAPTAPPAPANPNNLPAFKSAPPMTFGDRLKGVVANSAVGHAVQSTFPKAADALGITPTETVNSPDYQAHQQQFVAPEYLVPPSQNGGSQVARGALKAVGSATSAPSLATTAALAATGGVAAPLKYAPQALKYGMAVPAVKNLYDDAAGAVSKYRSGDKAGALEDAGGLGVNAALTAPALADMAPKVGEGMKTSASGIIDRTAGMRTKDYARGANPGRAYLDAGNGPALSMQSLADKAGASVEQSGAKLRNLYDAASTPSSPLIPPSTVEATINAPIQKGIGIAKGPGGNPANATQFSEYADTFKPTLDAATAKGGFTPSELFDVKKNIADNTNWRDQQQFNLNKVRQQNVGGIGGVLTDVVPEAKPENAIYQGNLSLATRAADRAQTGSMPLTNLFKKAGYAGAGAALGYAMPHSPAALVAAPLALAADSVPARTTTAYGLYQAGRGLGYAGRRMNNLFAPLTVKP